MQEAGTRELIASPPEEMRAKRRPYGRGGGVGRGLGVGVVLGAAGNWNLPTRVNQLTVAVPR